jgi:uncharacterized membrane protein
MLLEFLFVFAIPLLRVHRLLALAFACLPCCLLGCLIAPLSLLAHYAASLAVLACIVACFCIRLQSSFQFLFACLASFALVLAPCVCAPALCLHQCSFTVDTSCLWHTLLQTQMGKEKKKSKKRARDSSSGSSSSEEVLTLLTLAISLTYSSH